MASAVRHRRPHVVTTSIRKKGVVTIPRHVREQLDLQEGDHMIVTVEEGRLVLIPASVVPDDQTWFWTDEWQAKEREVDEALESGEAAEVFHNGDEMLSALAQRASVDINEIDADEVR